MSHTTCVIQNQNPKNRLRYCLQISILILGAFKFTVQYLWLFDDFGGNRS